MCWFILAFRFFFITLCKYVDRIFVNLSVSFSVYASKAVKNNSIFLSYYLSIIEGHSTKCAFHQKTFNRKQRHRNENALKVVSPENMLQKQNTRDRRQSVRKHLVAIFQILYNFTLLLHNTKKKHEHVKMSNIYVFYFF